MQAGVTAALVILSFAFTLLSHTLPASAATGINHQINFQGKLVNTNGTNVTDGNYSIVFSLYTVASGGSNIWTETQGTVAVASGIFQVSLGSVTTLPGSVDFNTDNLYLGIKVGADAEMTPRIQFTAVPQAFNSEKLGGLDKTGFIQNQTGSTQTADFKINGTGNIGTSLTTPILQSAAATALTITGNAASTWSTSAGNITLQAGGGTVTLGTTTILTSTNGLSITGGSTLSLDSTGANALTIGTTASAHNITIGNVTGSTGIILNTGTGGVLVNTLANSQMKVTSNALVPTIDQVNIDNTGSTGVVTAGVNALSVNYKGGAAAVEASAERIDLQPGTTAGGTWSASRIVQNVTGPATGVTSNGTKYEGPATTGGAGTYNAINIANIGTVASGGIVRGINITGTNSQAAGTIRGIQLNNLTAGAASEIGIDLGTGWDSLITYNNGAKVIVNSTGFVQNAAGGTGIDTSGSTGVPSVSAGTWSVSATLAATLGGTGTGTYAVGDLLTGDAGNTLAKIAAVASGSCLISQGVTTKPIWGSCAGGITPAAIDTVANSGNGIGISGSNIFLQSASGTQVGAVNISTQTFAGAKTFSSVLTASATGANALAVTGAPAGVTSSSLIQIGAAISSGSSSGTYISVNAPNAGAGSAADFVNFQHNGTSKFAVDATGYVFAAMGLSTGTTTLTNTDLTTATVNAGSGGYTANGTAGLSTLTCAGGQTLQNANVRGGIVTAGSCTSSLAKNGSDTSSASFAGNLYAFTNSNAGAAGVLSLTNGGTNSALTISQSLNPTAGQALIFANNSNGAPSGNLIDLQAASSSKFSVNTSGNVIAAGTIQFSALTTNGVLHTSGGNGTLAVSAVLLGSEVSGTLAATNGGTGQNTYAVGDLLTGDTSNTLSKITAVASGSCLISQGVTTKPIWGSCAGGITPAAIDTVANSGNGIGISGSNIFLQSASGTQVGAVNISTQTFAGAKTFSSALTASATGGNALAVTGAPTNSATSSLIQVGAAIAGGNAVANGGTYLGLNAPNAGAGSAADFLNLQKNGSSVLTIDNTGAITAAGAFTFNNLNNVVNGNVFIQAAGSLSVSGGGGATFSSAPTSGSSLSLVQVGNAISGGNAVANGGTYLGLNAPNAGAGSAADLVNFQKNGVTQLKVTNTGVLNVATGYQIGAAAASGNVLRGDGTNFVSATLAGSDITGAALTKTDDTNITLTLGGTPATSLLRAASLTLGWTGTLGVARGGTNIASYTSNSVLYASAATTISQATASAGQILMGNGSSVPTFTTVTGDVTIGSTGVTAIGANKVLDTMIRQGGATSVIGRSANSTGNVADISAASDGQVLRRIAGALGFGTLDNSSLTAGSFTNITGVGTLTAGALGAGFTVVNVAQGGTGAATFTSNGVIYGNTTGALQVTAAGTTNQCFIGNTGAAPGWGTCGAGNLVQVPTSNTANAAGANVISPTTANIVGLTVNATTNTSAVALIVNQANNTSPADAVQINKTSTGTQTNGLLFNHNGVGGTTTNGLNVTSSTGTITNGLQLTQSGGTFTTGINFTGIFGNLIVAPNFTVSNTGLVNGQTITSTANFTGTLAVAGINGTSFSVGTRDATTSYSYLDGLRISGDDTTNTIYNAAKAIVISADSGSNVSLCLTSTCTTGLTLQTSTGNVVIGAATPNYRLDVQGGDINTSANVRTGNTIRLDNAGNLTNIITVSSAAATALSVDSGTTGALNIGTGASAKTITVGNVTGATQIVLNTGSGGVLVNTLANSQLKVTSNALIPTIDQVLIDNTGSTGVTTAGVSGLQINYKGGAAAVESSASRIDLQPGGTAAGTWNALRVVQNVTGPATGVTSAGIKLEGPATTGGAGTYNAINIANIGTVASGGIVRGVNITGTNSQAAGTVRGIQLNNLTAGAASEIGIDLGTGWDSLLTYNNNAKVIINGTGFLQNTSGGTGIDTSGSTGVPSISAGTWSVAANLATSLGGTGVGTFTSNGVLYGNGAGNVLVTAAGTTGQCLVATTAAAPSWGSCAAGSNLQGAYTASTSGTTPEIQLDSTRTGLDIQDNNTTIGATQALLAVRASATSSTLGTGLFVVNASGKIGINTGSTSTTPTISYDLSFGQGANRTIGVETQATAATAGNNLTLTAGTGNTTGAGGLLTLQGGAATATAASAGGGVTLQGANGSSTGAGGNGGAVTINAGNGQGTGPTNGGTITLQAGSAAGTGTAGKVLVKNASNSITAFQIQDSSASALFTADTANMRLAVNATFALMAVPGAFTTSTATTGGTLAQNSTYRYKVTAIDSSGGETTPTAEVSQLTGNSTATNTITLTAWTASSGATSYRIYRTAANGATNSETLYDVVSKPGYTDTGVGAFTSGAVPAANDAYVSTNIATASTLAQTIGGLGTPAGQLYVSGLLPTSAIGKVPTNSNPWAIFHSGNYLYSVDNGGNSMQIFDVTNPASPILLTNFVITGVGEPNSVVVAGHYAYVADDGASKFFIIDIANPKLPVLVNTITTAAPVGQVLVQGRYAYAFEFVFNTSGNFQIFDVGNPASVPAALSNTSPASAKFAMQATVVGNYVYMTTQQSAGNDKLWIYDVSNPAAPALKNTGGTLLSSTGTASVVVSGHYLYNYNVIINPTFEAWDIKDPTAPVLVNTVSLDPAAGVPNTGSPQFFTIEGRLAYIVNPQFNDVNVVDISNPQAMRLLGAINTDLKPIAIASSGRYLYVEANVDSKIDIYDIGGMYTQALEVGSAVSHDLQVTGLAQFDGDLSVTSSVTVGSNLQVNEDLGVSGSAAFGGNVGIGTTSPQDLLHIKSSGNAILRVDAGASSFPEIDFYKNAVLKGSIGVEAATDDSSWVVNGVRRIYIKTTGVVGIGNTNPSYKLSVVDTQAAGPTAAVVNLSATDAAAMQGMVVKLGTATTGTASRFIAFYGAASTDANGTGVGRIRLNNGNVAYETGGADFAEWMTLDAAAGSGYIIGLNGASNGKAVATSKLIGVVSDKAAFIGNANKETPDATDATVGMLGQVDTYVSTENGAISAGDPITISSVPGVGMKATHAGQIIGHALASYNAAGVAKIPVLVAPSYFNPSDGDNIQAKTISTDSLQAAGDLVVGGDTAIAGDLNVSGATKLTNLEVSGNVSIAGELVAKGTTTLEGDLSVVGTTTVVDIIVGGHMITAGNAPTLVVGAAAGTSTINQPAPTATIDGTDNAGTVTVLSGTTITDSGVLAEVTFVKGYPTGTNFKIALTPTNDKALDLRVYVEKTATGFRIVSRDKLSAASTYSFDYIVIGARQTASN